MKKVFTDEKFCIQKVISKNFPSGEIFCLRSINPGKFIKMF